MSKFTDQLGEIKIHNLYNMASVGKPFIYFTSPEGRSVLPRRWMFVIKGKVFKDAPWYDNGALSFSAFGGKEGRDKGLSKALAKCKEMFPDIEMIKAPWSFSYVSKVDLDRVKALIEEKKE